MCARNCENVPKCERVHPLSAPPSAFCAAHQELAYKPTQEEDELIDRALEAADSQVISLHHMARDFFSDILDVDENILQDAEMMDVGDEPAVVSAGTAADTAIAVAGSSSTSSMEASSSTSSLSPESEVMAEIAGTSTTAATLTLQSGVVGAAV